MNIFFLDRDNKKCVQAMVDSHVVKMPLEYAQMLSTAIWESGGVGKYRKTHVNHPCSVWVRQSVEHWIWLREMVRLLNDEWRYRWGHAEGEFHKAAEVVAIMEVPELPNNGWVDPPKCMDKECVVEDVVESYRNYYRMKKTHIAKWKGREAPGWWENE